MTPGLPPGWQADDIHEAITVCQDGEIPATPSGWTQTDTVNIAAVNAQITWYWRRAVAGDTAPTFTGATSGSMAVIVGYRGCITTGTPHDTPTKNSGSGLTVTALNLDPSSTEALVVMLIGIESQFSSTAVSNYSGTDPAFTEAFDDFNSTGANWTGIAIADGTNDGAATGNRTADIAATTTAHWGVLMLSLIPAEASSAAGSFSSAGTGAFNSVGASTATTDLSFAGTGALNGVGASIANSVFNAQGAGDLAMIGTSIASAEVTVIGTGDLNAVGASVADSVFDAQGTGALTMVGTSLAAGDGAFDAQGTGELTMTGASVASAAISAIGTGAADFVGEGGGAVVEEPAPIPTGGGAGARGRPSSLRKKKKRELEREDKEILAILRAIAPQLMRVLH